MKFFLMQQNSQPRVIDVADIAEAWEGFGTSAGKTIVRLKSAASGILYDTAWSTFKTALQSNETVVTV